MKADAILKTDRIDMSAFPVLHEIGLDAYRPPDACYLYTPESIHGLAHAGRVLVWSNLIGRWMQATGIAIDMEVVRWAATLHDVRRSNDGKDPDHGVRCSAWVRGPGNRLLATISEEQRKQIAYCCAWHVPSDEEAPMMLPELICLKDADALDRVRLEALNINFLRTAFAKTLVHQAQFLCAASETQASFRTEPWNAVKHAALRMGVWSTLVSGDCQSVHQGLRFFAC